MTFLVVFNRGAESEESFTQLDNKRYIWDQQKDRWSKSVYPPNKLLYWNYEGESKSITISDINTFEIFDKDPDITMATPDEVSKVSDYLMDKDSGLYSRLAKGP